MTAHETAAKENKRAIQYLLERGDEFPQWATTVTFYAALHVVEAVFASTDPREPHTDDHATRNSKLKKTKRYAHLWRHYRPLFNDSLIARYLRSDPAAQIYERFADYLSADDVRRVHVDHHLHQIEESARRLIGEADFMR